MRVTAGRRPDQGQHLRVWSNDRHRLPTVWKVALSPARGLWCGLPPPLLPNPAWPGVLPFSVQSALLIAASAPVHCCSDVLPQPVSVHTLLSQAASELNRRLAHASPSSDRV